MSPAKSELVKSSRIELQPGKVTSAILRGEEDLSLWSDEELLRGTRRDKNGRWSGRPPKVVPKAVHDELVSRRMLEAHRLLGENLVRAVQVLVEVATDKRADKGTRVKAANTIIERVLGKVPERVHLAPDEAEPTWAKAIRAGMIQAIVPTENHPLPAYEDDDDT